MKYFKVYFFLLINFLPLFGCQKYNIRDTQLDNKTYISDFELLQQNPSNQTSIKITSPKAIIEPSNNNIEIFDSSIEILNNNAQDIVVTSGNSIFNNLSNSIKVFNNVKLSFLDNQDHYILTDSFNWNINSSVIYIDNPLNINFTNSEIFADSGLYNIESSQLKIDNSEFKRNVYNSKGKEEYQINIKSELAKWFKKDNTLLFTSNKKQVETTINFLLAE